MTYMHQTVYTLFITNLILNGEGDVALGRVSGRLNPLTPPPPAYAHADYVTSLVCFEILPVHMYNTTQRNAAKASCQTMTVVRHVVRVP